MKNNLKLFMLVDSRGIVVPGSGVLRLKKPATGRWLEVGSPYLCCTYSTSTSTTTEA